MGAGQITHRRAVGGRYVEPKVLIAEALRAAAQDAGPGGEGLVRAATSVRCVAVSSWQYRDVGRLVAADLGISPRETVQTSTFGGDGPQRLINETAQSIAAGELDVALIGGGDSVATLRAAWREGGTPTWTTQPKNVFPTRVSGSDQYPLNDAEAAVGLAAPLDMYALIETALCARAGVTPETHVRRISALWAAFSEVAVRNPHAWLPKAFTATQIATPTKANRLVAYPYTKLLSANPQVDQAAGLIICSVEAARRAGIPADRWVFIHAGAEAQDEWHVSERHDLTTSPAIRAIGDALLGHAGVGIDDIALIDLYSCFPAAVEIAAAELGLPLDDPGRPLTVTGGMTFAGGPGNSYAMHAVATLVERLREDPQALAVASGMGWYSTRHAIGLYSGTPPRVPFRSLAPTPATPATRRARTDYRGPATIEAFTVRRHRDGQPYGAAIAALTPAGDRAMIGPEAPEDMQRLLDEELLGAEITVRGPSSFSG